MSDALFADPLTEPCADIVENIRYIASCLNYDISVSESENTVSILSRTKPLSVTVQKDTSGGFHIVTIEKGVVLLSTQTKSHHYCIQVLKLVLVENSFVSVAYS